MFRKLAITTLLLGLAAITQGSIAALMMSNKGCREATQVNPTTHEIAACPQNDATKCNDQNDTCAEVTIVAGTSTYNYCRCNAGSGGPAGDNVCHAYTGFTEPGFWQVEICTSEGDCTGALPDCKEQPTVTWKTCYCQAASTG